MTGYDLLCREATGHRESGVELHHLVKTKTPKLVVTEASPATDQQITRLLHVIDGYVADLERQGILFRLHDSSATTENSSTSAALGALFLHGSSAPETAMIGTANLAPILGEKVSDHTWEHPTRRPELFGANMQGFGDAHQFGIGNAADPRLNFGDDVFGYVPAQYSAPRGQHGLCQSLLSTKGLDLRTNDVLGMRHLPKLEVDRSARAFRISSAFGSS